MGNLKWVIASNISALILFFVILQNARYSLSKKLFDNRVFFIMIYLCMLQSVFFIISYWLDYKHYFHSKFLAVVFNDVLYIDNIILALLFDIYVHSKLQGGQVIHKKGLLLMSIPAMIGLAFAFASLFAPLFFKINKDFTYERGSFYFVSPVVVLYYIINSLTIAHEKKNIEKEYLFFPILLFFIPMIFAMVLEFVFYGISVLMIACAISITSIYVNLQNQTSCVDHLSGLYTRQQLMNYLVDEINDKDSNKKIAGIMIDIDDFKHINDTYGHVVGDEAIRTMGKLIKQAVRDEELGFRFAGDEFFILRKTDIQANSTTVLDRLNALVDKFNKEQQNSFTLQFSAGSCYLERGVDTVESFIDKVDALMYKQKLERKKDKCEK